MTKIYQAKKLKEKKEKKTKKKKITKEGWIAIFMGLLMVLSGIGYMLGENNTTNTYHGINFITDGRSWIFTTHQKQILFLKIGGIKHQLTYHPQQLEYLNITNMDFLKNKKQIYITTTPTTDQQKDQIADYIKFKINEELSKENIAIGNAITKKTDKYYLPLITCKNATETTPVIEISYSTNETTNIKKEGNCLKIETKDPSEMIKIGNAIIYKILGVI